MVKHLPRKCEALASISRTKKTKMQPKCLPLGGASLGCGQDPCTCWGGPEARPHLFLLIILDHWPEKQEEMEGEKREGGRGGGERGGEGEREGHTWPLIWPSVLIPSPTDPEKGQSYRLIPNLMELSDLSSSPSQPWRAGLRPRPPPVTQMTSVPEPGPWMASSSGLATGVLPTPS
jgi:hypothetical protein